MITVDLLRHGELEGGVKYRGWVDDPLTQAGKASMDAVWSRLRGDVDLLVSSPLGRCSEPVRAWAQEAGVPCEIDSRVAEMHYGEWEGLTSEEIMVRYPGMLEKWRRNPAGMSAPGGESAEQLQARISEFWSDISNRYDGKHLLIVSHSGSMRMLLAHILSAPIATTRLMQMPYSCWSRAAIRDGRSELVFHNQTVESASR